MTLSFVTIEKTGKLLYRIFRGVDVCLIKRSERYLSDDHRKNGDQAFESAFRNQGPEFESAFQEEKAEKRHFFFDPCFAIDTLRCELGLGLVILGV